MYLRTWKKLRKVAFVSFLVALSWGISYIYLYQHSGHTLFSSNKNLLKSFEASPDATRSIGSKPLQKLTAESTASHNSKDDQQHRQEQQQKQAEQEQKEEQRQQKQEKEVQQQQQQQQLGQSLEQEMQQQEQQQRQQQEQQHQHESLQLQLIQPTNVVKGKPRNCSFWSYPAEVKTFENPLIKLDPTRFIYPGIVWGPNNQAIGMMDSTLFAIKLNRTLVIPKFRGHFWHPRAFPPYQAIDVERLCKFVSCIPWYKLREKCGDSFDVVFQFSPNNEGDIRMFEADTGMKILHPSRIDKSIPFPSRLKTTGNNVYEIPALPNSKSKKILKQESRIDVDNITTEYSTSAKCAVAATVFRVLDIPNSYRMAIPLKENKNHFDATNEELIFATLDAIRHPPCIIQAAKDYIRDVLNNRKYVGFHWRYELKDWYPHHCGRPAIRVRWEEECVKLKNFGKPDHLAKVISEAIEKELNVSRDVVNHTPIPIYIAMPTNIEQFRNDVYKNILTINKNFIKPTEHIATYLTKQYNQCWKETGWINLEEMFSLCEMEIMILSEWFIYSPGSTWSANVRPYRLTRNEKGELIKRYEERIFSLL